MLWAIKESYIGRRFLDRKRDCFTSGAWTTFQTMGRINWSPFMGRLQCKSLTYLHPSLRQGCALYLLIGCANQHQSMRLMKSTSLGTMRLQLRQTQATGLTDCSYRGALAVRSVSYVSVVIITFHYFLFLVDSAQVPNVNQCRYCGDPITVRRAAPDPPRTRHTPPHPAGMSEANIGICNDSRPIGAPLVVE